MNNFEEFINNEEFELYASHPRALDDHLINELNKFGVKALNPRFGGVGFTASRKQLSQMLLYSRIASRLFLKLTDLEIRNEKDVYDDLAKVPWTDVFKHDRQTFKFQANIPKQCAIRSPIYLAQLGKDAVVDVFKDKTGKRPNVDTKNPDLSFLIQLDEIKGKRKLSGGLWIDLCGTPLSHRGYRGPKALAPLRENLAQGIIQTLEWEKTKTSFMDGMCGSGTLLIEGIMHSYDLPGSYLKIIDYKEGKQKPWAILQSGLYKRDKKLQETFVQVLEDYYQQILEVLENPPKQTRFFGRDISEDQLVQCKKNLRKAKVFSFTEVKRGNIEKLRPPFDSGVLVCNPPYGERLGEMDALEVLYFNLGENLKQNFKGINAYILTNTPDLRKKISLKTSSRTPFWNGKIECRLLGYKLY